MQHVTGFGLYDRRVIEVIRRIDDPYPYFRGLIADIGFEAYKFPYKQPQRKRGLTKNNFYTLYDMAMLGITNHSKVPLRVATMAGFVMGDLLSRRGQVQGQDMRANAVVINAMVPLSNMFGYVNQLRSGTQGRANFTMQFDHYEQVPASIASEIIEKFK